MRRYKYYYRQDLKVRKPKYQWHPWKSFKGSIITLFAFMAIVIYWGHTNAILASKTAEAGLAGTLIAQKDFKTEQLIRENEQLKERLAFSEKIETDQTTQKIVLLYINQIFQKDAQTAQKTFWCESHYNPLVNHQNSDTGRSTDHGVAQINSSWAPTFEKVMKVPFYPYVHDVRLNLEFAKWIKDNTQSGWKNWVCYDLYGG